MQQLSELSDLNSKIIPKWVIKPGEKKERKEIADCVEQIFIFPGGNYAISRSPRTNNHLNLINPINYPNKHKTRLNAVQLHWRIWYHYTLTHLINKMPIDFILKF